MSVNGTGREPHGIERIVIELVGLLKYAAAERHRAWRLALLVVIVASTIKADFTLLDVVAVVVAELR